MERKGEGKRTAEQQDKKLIIKCQECGDRLIDLSDYEKGKRICDDCAHFDRLAQEAEDTPDERF